MNKPDEPTALTPEQQEIEERHALIDSFGSTLQLYYDRPDTFVTVVTLRELKIAYKYLKEAQEPKP